MLPLNEAGVSSSLRALPLFFSIAMALLTAARGNVLGNKAIRVERTARIPAKISQPKHTKKYVNLEQGRKLYYSVEHYPPSHQAPNHLGSFIAMVGVRLGET